MIDSHAHLYFDRFDDDRDDVIARARAAGVDRIINVGIDVPSSEAAIELANRHEGLYATVALHPTSRVDDVDRALARLRELAIEHREHVVAIGEFGLDYYWDDVPHAEQPARAEKQLDLALELDLPVIFHCRDALEDLLSLLERRERQPPGVFHCFSGDADETRRALALGYCISFAGNVTYPKAENLRESARLVPLDRLLLETDSPFLAPQGFRGKRNEPAYVPHIRDALAKTKGTTPDELAAATVATTERLFRLGSSEAR